MLHVAVVDWNRYSGAPTSRPLFPAMPDYLLTNSSLPPLLLALCMYASIHPSIHSSIPSSSIVSPPLFYEPGKSVSYTTSLYFSLSLYLFFFSVLSYQLLLLFALILFLIPLLFLLTTLLINISIFLSML